MVKKPTDNLDKFLKNYLNISNFWLTRSLEGEIQIMYTPPAINILEKDENSIKKLVEIYEKGIEEQLNKEFEIIEKNNELTENPEFYGKNLLLGYRLKMKK